MSNFPIGSGLFRSTPYWLNFIFDGRVYNFTHSRTIEGGATVYYEFRQDQTTPYLFHTVMRNHAFQSGGPFNVDLLEDATFTPGTTEITANNVANLDRRWNRPTKTQVFTDPTNVSGGNVIDRSFIASAGGGGQSAGSIAGDVFERVLHPDRSYLLRIINNGNAGDLFTGIVWYESGN